MLVYEFYVLLRDGNDRPQVLKGAVSGKDMLQVVDGVLFLLRREYPGYLKICSMMLE